MRKYEAPYNHPTVPTAVKLLLADVYNPAGVETWWNAANTMLDGNRPCTLWHAGGDNRKHVLLVLEVLAGGAL